MRAAGASRTLVITAVLMLAIGVAACADDDASEPARLSGVEEAARPEAAEETGGGPPEEAGETPAGAGRPPTAAADRAAAAVG